MTNQNDWPLKPLKNLTTKIGSGATPRGGKNTYLSEGISLIRSLNVYDFMFKYNDLAFISTEQAKGLLNAKVQMNDILLNITGASVTRCCIVPSKVLPARVNQHVSIIRVDPDVANPQFYLNVLNSPMYKHQLLTLAQGGATREALTKETIENLLVPFPSLQTQHNIAGILSAYDDLIENNTRRIQILEEMVQTIYREWFVHYRFPGHEKVRMVDSGTELGMIPEGWEVVPLSDVCISIVDGDWIETKDQSGHDYRLLQISNIGFGEFKETGNFRYISQETFDRLNCTEITPYDILVARMPKPIGRAWLVSEMPWRMITAVDVAIVKVDTKIVSPHYCVSHLNSPHILDYAKVLATGTTRPRITRSNLSKMPIVVPPRSLTIEFDAFAETAFSQVNILKKKNENLKVTRDVLLPKLISGEIDINDLDIEIPFE